MLILQAQAAVANAQKMVSQYTASPSPYNIPQQGNQFICGKRNLYYLYNTIDRLTFLSVLQNQIHLY